nr:hypothetical protein [Tanacetum cinerariifolium]
MRRSYGKTVPKDKEEKYATWFKEKFLLVEAQGNGKVLNEEEMKFLADPGIAEGPVTQSVITYNEANQANDLDAYGFDCDKISTTKAKAQPIRPVLYDGSVIAKETNVISIADSKETLMLELNQLSEYFGKRFILQQELFGEQAFWLQTSHPNTNQSVSLPVKIVGPLKLPKEKVFVITTLKNDLRKLKGKEIAYNTAQLTNATTISLGMYKLDPAILDPQVKNNREAHEYYLKHTMEQAAIVKLIQELLGYVRDTFPDIQKPRVNHSTKIPQTPSSNEMTKVEVQSWNVKSSLNKQNPNFKNVCKEHVKHPVKGKDCAKIVKKHSKPHKIKHEIEILHQKPDQRAFSAKVNSSQAKNQRKESARTYFAISLKLHLKDKVEINSKG